MKRHPPVIGVDTGGTFTDLVFLHDGRLLTHKTPSTPTDFSIGVLRGIDALLGYVPAIATTGFQLVHSTTVATNALLERKGAKAALITTEGFRDVLEIGRQQRHDLYNLNWERPSPLVPRPLRVELSERVYADGSIGRRPRVAEINALLATLEKRGVESIAVSLLFSFLHPDHEQAVARAARRRKIPVYLSSDIAPEFREYERTSTTVVNAFVSPTLDRYLHTLSDEVIDRGATHVRVVQSNGGSLSIETAAHHGVRTLLSGPAAGLQGALEQARSCLEHFKHDPDRMLTFDMGGTSTDVSLVDGEPSPTHEGQVAGIPIQVAMVDVHTVGAGGGSIAHVDAGGLLHVGPGSAGADPGPACYGKGTLPTVTDANVLAGRLPPDHFLGGRMPLYPERALQAMAALADTMSLTTEEAALDVLRVVNDNMVRALRFISVERGYDPRLFTLVAYGGAGGLHACDIADSLDIQRVVVPHNPGVVSAWGCVTADVIKDYARTVMQPFEQTEEPAWIEALHELAHQAKRDLDQEGFAPDAIEIEPFLDLRYAGQSFELTVPCETSLATTAESFHDLHRQRYGHSNRDAPLEIVTVRVRGTGPSAIREQPLDGSLDTHPSGEASRYGDFTLVERLSLPPRARIQGPALLTEDYSTLCIPADWIAHSDLIGNLLLEKR